jgi:hypothetical protein
VTAKIKLGKFDRSPHPCDDTDADILADGVRVGTVTACRDNIGGPLTPRHRVTAYVVSIPGHADYTATVMEWRGGRWYDKGRWYDITPTANALRAAMDHARRVLAD